MTETWIDRFYDMRFEAKYVTQLMDEGWDPDDATDEICRRRQEDEKNQS